MSTGYDFLDQLRDDLVALPAGTGGRRRPRVALIAAGGLAVVCIVVVGSFAVVPRFDHGATHNTAGGILGPAPVQPGTDPFPEGQTMSLGGAETAAGFHIPQPNAPGLATPRTLGNVWYATTPIDGGPQQNRQIALYYPTRQIEITMWPSQMTDPSKGFARIASESGDPRSVLQTVKGGLPALVFAQNSDPTGQNPGSVTFVLNGLYVEVIGHLPTDQLKRIANSMT